MAPGATMRPFVFIGGFGGCMGPVEEGQGVEKMEELEEMET